MIEIIREEQGARTRGLANLGQPDLVAEVSIPHLALEAEAFLKFVTDYLRSSRRRLRSGETLVYGYWLTKFIAVGDDLQAWEYSPDATEFRPGITLAVTYWRDQHRTCERLGAEFKPPRPDNMVVISEGLLEGDKDVQGVRYPSPQHMSGWWLTTNRFDGDTRSLKTTHAYHVTAARPDLAHLLALPAGFRFDLSQGEDVWFDDKIASEQP